LAKKKSKQKKGIVIIIAVVIFVIASIVAFSFINLYNSCNSPADITKVEDILFTIDSGAVLGQVSEELETQKIIKSAFWFKLRAKLGHSNAIIKAGEYYISPSMTSDEIIEIITSNKTATKKIRIIEGQTLKRISENMVASRLMTEDEYWDLIKNGNFDYDFLKDAPIDETRLEGFLLPGTYSFSPKAKPVEVLTKILDAFDEAYTPEMYTEAASQGRTVREIVIIASMIERETAAKNEKPMVASVINNRISKGMKLQIDATIQYILPEPKERLTIADTQINSPYNTYVVEGLPAGPICNPSIGTIKAVLDPDHSNYLYYVLDKSLDGHHNFSETYEEHLGFKEEYQKALKERDEKK
jgi:UPF0755 protein